MAFLTEPDVELALLEQLHGLGYTIAKDTTIGPDGPAPERESHAVVILHARLEQAVARLNPQLPPEARATAIRTLSQNELPNLLEENRRLHTLLTEGVDVAYDADDGVPTAGKVTLLDIDRPENNDWLAVQQFAVISGQSSRRADVVVFVNGLPLAVIELKGPGNAGANLVGAFNQLQTYKQDITALFHTNAVLVTSDGITARIGSLSADLERFMPWRTSDGHAVIPKGQPELTTLIDGVFAQQRFLHLMRSFTVFGETGHGLVKIIAGYHQYHAVNHAVESTLRAASAQQGVHEAPELYGLPSVATQPQGDRRAGVIWHTQGSGKSLLMVFYAARLVQHAAMKNPTLVVITDRSDLDDQLFATFSMCKDLLRQTPIKAQSRKDLQTVLARACGGVIFTTLQKFGEVDEPLTERSNVVVIADEAHRSQYGLKAKFNRKSGVVSYGFAKYMRDALPNASFIGFTGTPIEATDINTPALFGQYIDIYDISRAVEDGATVPIYYESRLARIELDLDEDEKPILDAEVDALFEDAAADEKEVLKGRGAALEQLVGSQKRLALVARDLVTHVENRFASLDGKAMVVCMSRKICVALYKEITQLRPDWHHDDDTLGAVKIVMTGAASDPPEWKPHLRSKARRDLLDGRVKDPNDPLKLVIVRDLWLTGFNAPSLHTMYVDKPMKGHGLMQAIARVNRVFRDKPAGLIVDYIGIAHNLKSALAHYSRRDKDTTGIDAGLAIAQMREKYEVVRDMYHGFDYSTALGGTPQQRLEMMAGAIEWILDQQQHWAAAATTAADKKNAHRRYRDAVLALSTAFALASASDEARAIREEVGFFQAIHHALAKNVTESGISTHERDYAIRQIVSRAVVSTEIVDILKAAGIQSPDISILSDAFLAEVAQMEKKNLALEALRKLINDGIRSRNKSNIVQTKAFTQRLEEAIARYHANAITTAGVLEELIQIAKDIRTARARGEEQGLSADEIAFYDALAENDSAVQIIGDDQLKVIAHELLKSLKGNVTVDWARRDSARARMRVLVKRILRCYGYPPDLQDAAVQTVLRQAEALSAVWNLPHFRSDCDEKQTPPRSP